VQRSRSFNRRFENAIRMACEAIRHQVNPHIVEAVRAAATASAKE